MITYDPITTYVILEKAVEDARIFNGFCANGEYFSKSDDKNSEK